MKLTAQMVTADNGKSFYALHVDGKLVKKQEGVKLEQSVGELDRFTVTLIGKVDADGVMQICEV